MDTNNVERNLRSLRRLYSLLQANANKESTIPEPFLLDEDTQSLLKSLLDSVTKEILATQSKIIAAAQFGLSETIQLLNLPDSSSTIASTKDYNYKREEEVTKSSVKALGRTRTNNASQIKRIGSALRANGTIFKRNESGIDPIARIETALSALSFRSDRVESDDRTKSCKSPTIEEYSSVLPYEEYETQRLTEKALMEHRQRTSQRASSSKISPSLRSVNEATEAIVRRSDDRTLPPNDDQFVRIKSRRPLPPLPGKSVGFKKPSHSQSKRMTQKTMSIKPTLLDQETESWDESESDKTRSRTSSDGEELVSTEQESEENSRETESRASGSSWETQEESVTGEEKSIDESSYTSESEDYDDSEVSASPPRKTRGSDLAKQRKMAMMGRFTRLKNKFGQVFHLHQHHHHHHHPHPHEEEKSRKPSAWNHLQKALHYKRKEKAVEKRMKSEFKGLTTQKQKGGHFQGLVEGLMRHRKRKSTKQKTKLPSHGRKKNWWQTYKRQGRVKFPKKLAKRPYLLKKDQ